ncbi:MAG TPA: BNR-4 repeat-containing protein, partial [Opitutaceae bacterium]|nr:BNR-4 repeat-containing protein [Opitutaceae bacterium]
RTNLYYVQTKDFGETWTTAEGVVLTLPLETIDNPALVRDYAAEGKLLYTCDLNFDAKGNPILLYVLSCDFKPGPAGGEREWTTAHWKEGKWRYSTVATSDHNYDMGSLYVLPTGEWRVVAPTDPGPQPWGTGGDMVMWSSKDEGNSWVRVRTITEGSAFNHSYARRPVQARDPFFSFWADGDPSRLSESRLYFTNANGDHVWRLPYTMKEELASPEIVR